MPPFERTTCDCSQCQVGCQTMPGSLRLGDAERIADHLGEAYDDNFLLRYFQASEGPLVSRDGVPFRVPTLVPKLTPDGCVFFSEGRCQIHAVAPFGCSHFDVHMTREEGDARSCWHISELLKVLQAGDHPYYRGVALLAGREQVAPPLHVRRAAFVRVATELSGES